MAAATHFALGIAIGVGLGAVLLACRRPVVADADPAVLYREAGSGHCVRFSARAGERNTEKA